MAGKKDDDDILGNTDDLFNMEEQLSDQDGQDIDSLKSSVDNLMSGLDDDDGDKVSMADIDALLSEDTPNMDDVTSDLDGLDGLDTGDNSFNGIEIPDDLDDLTLDDIPDPDQIVLEPPDETAPKPTSKPVVKRPPKQSYPADLNTNSKPKKSIRKPVFEQALDDLRLRAKNTEIRLNFVLSVSQGYLLDKNDFTLSDAIEKAIQRKKQLGELYRDITMLKPVYRLKLYSDNRMAKVVEYAGVKTNTVIKKAKAVEKVLIAGWPKNSK